MKIITIVALILFQSAIVSEFQVSSGTIVVAVHSKRKIAVAADSRFTLSENRSTDQGCKIANLGGNLIFAATGTRVYGRKIGQEIYVLDIYKEARQVVASIPLTPQPQRDGTTKIVAEKWAEVVAEKFNVAAPWKEEGWLAGQENDIIADAIFAGIEPGGVAVAIAVIKYHGPLSSALAKPRVTVHTATSEVHADARGKGEVADKYIHPKSNQAKAENDRWRRWAVGDPQHFHARIASRLVELTIQNLPDAKSLGGPIDVLTLTPSDGVRWIRRKSNCPAD